MKTAVELEKEFDSFFEMNGYLRVSKIVGDSPTFKNADYISTEKKIVVELKIIDKDHFENGGIIHKLNAIVTIPKNIDENGFGQYEFSLPGINREGNHDTIEESLRRVLKKANRQIKETKEELLNNEGNGFVIIALNMQTVFDPEKIRELIASLVSREFSSIDGFIICTPGWGLLNISNGHIHPVCLPTTEFGCAEYIELTCNEIGQLWCEFASKGGHQ